MKIGEHKLIPILGDTKEWFKKDIKTIKNSLKVTVKRIPLIVLITFTITNVIYYLLTSQLNFFEAFIYFLVFTPIVVLAFFMLHVLKTKGYDIMTP